MFNDSVLSSLKDLKQDLDLLSYLGNAQATMEQYKKILPIIAGTKELEK